MTIWMMIRRNLLFSLVGSGIVCIVLAGTSEAAVPRAFLSTTGSDSNPRSPAQPCRSFNQALTVVEPGGEIVVQDSGGYSIGFTITQSVTIDAAGLNASVISTSATDLCTINASANDRVVLRGISFHGANLGQNAINVLGLGSLYVEHCSISEFTSSGILSATGRNIFVAGTDVRACQFGIGVENVGATNSAVVVRDSTFTECNSGMTIASLSLTEVSLVARDSEFTKCGTGISLEADGPGRAFGSMSNCGASLCGVGFRATSNSGANADLALINCRATRNTAGLEALSSSTGTSTIRIAGCLVTQNTAAIGISLQNASVLATSPGTNLIAGNINDGPPSAARP